MTVIIKRASDDKFMTGVNGGWSEEYPDAHQFSGVNKARQAAKKVAKTVIEKDNEAADEYAIIRNYGYQSEACEDVVFFE